MSNFVYILLDTTAPSNPVITISGGAIYATNQLVNIGISVGDAITTGYQMKIFGDVDLAHNTNIQKTEANSVWIPYNTSSQIKLSNGDGAKTISMRVRDEVHNSSSIAVDNITMDTAIPTVIVSTPDVSKVSKIAGKNIFNFTFTSNEDFLEYKVKIVGNTGATHDTGTLIPTTKGSINTQGVGQFSEGQVMTVTITGEDLELANATEGQNIIKVFVRDSSSLWSA